MLLWEMILVLTLATPMGEAKVVHVFPSKDKESCEATGEALKSKIKVFSDLPIVGGAMSCREAAKEF